MFIFLRISKTVKMPKASSITKERIIDAAFEIVRVNGFVALSARNIAKKIGCSTQPIYWTYKNMEMLKQDVLGKMMHFLNALIGSYRKTGEPFLDLGLGYVHIAFAESVLFKSIYVDNVLKIKLTEILPDETMKTAMRKETEMADLSDEQINEIGVKAWIFTHGLASLIATGVMVYNEEKIETMLRALLE
jgi:AcrR family transcriptional regulator